MESAHVGAGERAVVTRVDDLLWEAVEDDLVVGRGGASHRPDGRMFLSIDSWLGTVVDRLADAMVADLPTPLYTVVDGSDHDMTSRWQRAGFTIRRREWEYVVPTGVPVTRPSPSGLTILPLGAAQAGPLRDVYAAVRAEVEATVGWESMPAEVLGRPDGVPVDPSRYAVAAVGERYVGLARVLGRRRHARIGLIAVRAELHHRGIARALLADLLASLHRGGIDTASAEVDESNTAATALFEGVGARRVGSGLELVRR